MSKKRRIFIGYSLSEELQHTIKNWQDTCSYLPVRWIAPCNLHITFVPPWYEENTAHVISRLQTIQKAVLPVSIHLETISLGPDRKHPRLLWARGKTPKNFILLKNWLTDLLRKEKEKRVPLLHVTVARFGSEQYASFPTRNFSEKIDWHDTVNAITVFESHLNSTGAMYEKIADIPLH